MGDDEAASGGLVLGLTRHDRAVDVVRVRSCREDEEERSHADKDVERRRHRTLQTLGGYSAVSYTHLTLPPNREV